ncbi:polysaccharide pyruvyl transferase family protein [Winogradskyella sp.]|uniref:polysaccharide pyruvyl transferase family protein n=1 Tax=Winogradskyella sp. TaxID=1883156 RepID=UPI003BAC85AF
MKYALFEHKQNNLGLVNIGDHIQSCAAEQFLPSVDFYVERDALNRKEYDKAKIIMNGWFTDAPHNWPPNPNLIPLFISFHMQPRSAEIILSKKENVDYLKSHAPIGCRDYKTLEILQSHGIESYFSFCLTTTLDEKYKSKTQTDKIYLVDPLYNYDIGMIKRVNFFDLIKKFPFKKLGKIKDYVKPKAKLDEFVPDEIIQKASVIKHYVSAENDNAALYKEAKDLLGKYAEAKLVITSRIHCALPCLALGTPVLFVMEGLVDEKLHMSRFRGILDHINVLTKQPKEEFNKLFGKEMNIFHPNEIDWDNPPKNPESFRDLSNRLKERCKEFISKAND